MWSVGEREACKRAVSMFGLGRWPAVHKAFLTLHPSSQKSEEEVRWWWLFGSHSNVGTANWLFSASLWSHKDLGQSPAQPLLVQTLGATALPALAPVPWYSVLRRVTCTGG